MRFWVFVPSSLLAVRYSLRCHSKFWTKPRGIALPSGCINTRSGRDKGTDGLRGVFLGACLHHVAFASPQHWRLWTADTYKVLHLSLMLYHHVMIAINAKCVKWLSFAFFVCVDCLCLVKGFLCERVFCSIFRAELRLRHNIKAAQQMLSDTG